PLPRRRALHGRLSAERKPDVGLGADELQRLPAGSRAGRRALACYVARPSRTRGIFSRGVARTFPARRLLGARLNLRKLRRHNRWCVCHGRLGRRLQHRDSPALGWPPRPAQGPYRTLGPSLSARRRAGSGHRIPAGGAPLVGSLAEGHRYGRYGRADAAGLDAGKRPAKAVLQISARPLGCGNPMAFAAYHLQTLLARCESAEQRTDGRNSTRFSFPANNRSRSRRMVWIWRTRRGSAGPAW